MYILPLTVCIIAVNILLPLFKNLRHKVSGWSSEDEIKELNAVVSPPSPADGMHVEGAASGPSYKKSLRLSSDQIVRPRDKENFLQPFLCCPNSLQPVLQLKEKTNIV